MGFEKELEKAIKDLLQNIPFSVEEISIGFDEAGSDLWCSLSSSDSRHLIGRDGETLGSLTHLLKKILDKRLRDSGLENANFILDINGYQKKRISDLRARAHMLAERARFFKSSVEAPPMSSFDRRIIHDHLTGCEDLRTESSGVGRDRKVVIYYEKPS